MTIQVTQEDINKGEPNTIEKCPIALAINRKYKWRRASVSNYACYLYPKNDLYYLIPWLRNRYFFKLPLIASNFIVDFDLGKTVKPFTFELE